jgi:transposase
VSGTTDPVVLADLARGRLRKKIPALREALEGRFDAEHVVVVGRIAHIDYLDEAIDELSAAIEKQLGPFAPAVELLCTIPGVGRRAAEVIIAETGGDMTAFPTAKHLASWAGMCPGNDESAGKRRMGKTRKGSKWFSQTLVECAKSANRSKNTYACAAAASATGRFGRSRRAGRRPRPARTGPRSSRGRAGIRSAAPRRGRRRAAHCSAPTDPSPRCSSRRDPPRRR